MSTFRWQGKDFGAWLVTIARNLVADHFKSGRYRLEIESTGTNPTSTSYEFYAGYYYADAGSDTPDTLQVALDRETYRAGDTATLSLAACVADDSSGSAWRSASGVGDCSSLGTRVFGCAASETLGPRPTYIQNAPASTRVPNSQGVQDWLRIF